VAIDLMAIILDRAFAVTYLEQADAATFTRLMRPG